MPLVEHAFLKLDQQLMEPVWVKIPVLRLATENPGVYETLDGQGRLGIRYLLDQRYPQVVIDATQYPLFRGIHRTARNRPIKKIQLGRDGVGRNQIDDRGSGNIIFTLGRRLERGLYAHRSTSSDEEGDVRPPSVIGWGDGYIKPGHPDLQAVFDAMSVNGDSSTEGCPPDWSRDVLDHARSKDIETIKKAFSGRTEGEAAFSLGLLG